MSNKNVKVVKNKKSKLTLNKILYYLKSLYNNAVCKEIGSKHWILSIFVLIFSLLISVIPLLVSESTKTGSSGINSLYNDVLQETIYEYATSEDTIDFEIKDHEFLPIGEMETSKVLTFTQDDYRMDFYYFDTKNTGITFNEAASSLLSNDSSIKSIIFFGTSQYTIYVYDSSSTLKCSSVGGYNHMDDISSFKDYLKEETSSLTSVSKIKEQIMTNLYAFTDLGYLDYRTNQVLLSVGLLLAINLGITLIVMIILFIMTRGKNNPNRILKFYEVMGISFFLTLSPAIISLILGFIIGSSFQIMAMMFVMAYGLRAMYLSMKYLKTPIE